MRIFRNLSEIQMGALTDDSNGGMEFTSTRNPLKRLYGQGDLHFVTFSCYRRLPLLGAPRSRDRFVKILDVVRNRHQFHLFGYVVMPEHVHLLISEPSRVSPSIILQVLKQKVSSELTEARALYTLDQPTRRPNARMPVDTPFWQRRFYDFNVWNTAKIKEKLRYMHTNPVERSLVADPNDWPWSSWSYCATGKEGLLGIDSLADDRIVKASAQSQNPHP